VKVTSTHKKFKHKKRKI